MQSFFGFGSWEIALIVAVLMAWFWRKTLIKLGLGFRRGLFEFRKGIQDVEKEASEAGRSVGGIYGKSAFQALTPDNNTAELYNPDLTRVKIAPRKRHPGVLKKYVKIPAWMRRSVRTLFARLKKT